MSTTSHITLLRSLAACEDGIEFAEEFDSLADAWEQCQRADWMVWLLCREPGSADPLRIKRVCVEFSVGVCKDMPLPDGRKLIDLMADPRSVAAVEMAEKWLKGDATHEELDRAAHAAVDAAYAAYAAVDAAYPAHAAVDAAYAAYAARAAARSWQADLIRELIGNPYGKVIL